MLYDTNEIEKERQNIMNMKQTLRYLLVALCLCANSALSMATIHTYDQANAAYADGRYSEAVALYQTIIAEQGQNINSEAARVYYNLGNAYFKQGELAQSILAYERALRLDPGYEDAEYNLVFAQSRITDNIKDNDFFLSSWAVALRNSASEHVWWWISVGLFVVGLIGILVFLLYRSVVVRKVAFYIACVAFVCSLVGGVNARSLHKRDVLRNEAIITQGIVNAKSSPDRSGTDLFTVHEGTKVVIQETIGDWANVRVAQYEGWIELRTLERI